MLEGEKGLEKEKRGLERVESGGDKSLVRLLNPLFLTSD